MIYLLEDLNFSKGKKSLKESYLIINWDCAGFSTERTKLEKTAILGRPAITESWIARAELREDFS